MTERELEELKCYACNGKVCRIGDDEFNDWVISYKKDFRESYISIGDEPLNVNRHYFDPDTSYVKGTDHSFFYDLVTFLTRREEEMKKMKEKFPNNLKGSFEYRFTEGKGIKVSGTYSKGEEMQPFYLRSDQFGFSAPVNEKCYPYDLYIKKRKNKDKAIEQVIKWISMSRTIGGSFLWSKSPYDDEGNSFYKRYNMGRGGTITFRNRFYIQDRVDLTLWEIKDWYSKHNREEVILKEQSILERCSEEKPDIEQWLLHFGDFKTYATFFMFDEFVSSDGLYNPINIITGKLDAPVRGADGENPEPAITKSMNLDSLENMLQTLNNKIVKRSIEMTKIIDKEKQGS